MNTKEKKKGSLVPVGREIQIRENRSVRNGNSGMLVKVSDGLEF